MSAGNKGRKTPSLNGVEKQLKLQGESFLRNHPAAVLVLLAVVLVCYIAGSVYFGSVNPADWSIGGADAVSAGSFDFS